MNGVYIHIPFCTKKCRYCDFVSYENCLSEGEEYVHTLLLEMEQYQGIEVDTIYIGGGTPTVLPPHLLIRILEGAEAYFQLAPEAEVTVEANPGTCGYDYFAKLKTAGVNRISLGVQSFVDEELSLLGRIHTAKEAKDGVLNAYRAGILDVSLDLMFSIPAQSRESFLYSIRQAMELQPTHISCYSLTLCEGTPFYTAAQKGELMLPDEEEDRALYALLTDTLKQKGYHRYEISNFAQPGHEARHNTKYWTRKPYIGLGAAAHSFYGGCRFENPPQLAAYKQVVHGEKEREKTLITPKDAMAEFMFLGLRMTEVGISRQDFFNVFGQPIEKVYGAQLKKLQQWQLLEVGEDRIRLTERGIDVSNGVFCEFV